MINDEKINIINNRISNIDTHIDILLKDITNNPDNDIVGKPTRQSVLDDFRIKKQVLLNELDKLS